MVSLSRPVGVGLVGLVSACAGGGARAGKGCGSHLTSILGRFMATLRSHQFGRESLLQRVGWVHQLKRL